MNQIAIIGAGKLGTTLARGLLAGNRPADSMQATVRTAASVEKLAELGIQVHRDNLAAVRDAGTVLLTIKPRAAQEVCSQLRGLLEGKQVISTMASVTLAQLRHWLGDDCHLARAMPNTPCQVGAGMTVLCGDESAVAAGAELFDTLGRTMVLDERHLDAVTALGASGVAFIYVVLEALAEGGVKTGLPRHVATEIAAQAALGAAQMVLESGAHPALLKDDVTTPAGCTIDGLMALEAGGLRVTLIQAVVEAARRAGELAPGE